MAESSLNSRSGENLGTYILNSQISQNAATNRMEKKMKATAKTIESALVNQGLRSAVNGIENNPATPDEVVLWIGGAGVPVYTVEQAIAAACAAGPHSATCECGNPMECNCKDGKHDPAVYMCARCDEEFYGDDEN